MSIVVRFSPIALTAKKYDETIRQIENAGDWPPAGLDYHVCFGSDGNLKVSEIWNSREQFEGERPAPAHDVFAWGALLHYLACGAASLADVPQDELRVAAVDAAMAALGLP